ncbi:uncharacterized protein BCR38DRAFT_410510 [Pseudomassariella vexata]|uniref:Major facilitator superfamily (MFS) profile domain-containing protein n=1 Tax=Pseudomassariella vexata TaxID=1141098 RepID=A0A1Y2DS08_9PEZI|nr:uncharacterized protein BCR38DRAFT_410510 [Pseudomassariella vexata]ORY62062.1 hypothetical protein BCR38DRAFT_410510 [Pseudomassariella vexata]
MYTSGAAQLILEFGIVSYFLAALTALSTSTFMFFVVRFISGYSCAGPMVIGGAVIVDVIPTATRGNAMAIWALGLLIEPTTCSSTFERGAADRTGPAIDEVDLKATDSFNGFYSVYAADRNKFTRHDYVLCLLKLMPNSSSDRILPINMWKMMMVSPI